MTSREETPETGAKKAPSMQSMDRGMKILELLAERPMRAKDVADATGAKWATVHRTLAYLRDEGYVRRDEPTGIYYVGRRTFSIGSAYLSDHPLFTTSEPLMRTASDRVNGFVQIAEREGNVSVAIASVEPRIPVPTLSYANAFRSYPLHAGARGLLLLAFSPDEFIEEYVSAPLRKLTDFTISDPNQLREKLADIREKGWADSDRDVTMVTNSVAGAIRASDGSVMSSVCIINYREHIIPGNLVFHEVMGLAQSLSQLMGWRNR